MKTQKIRTITIFAAVIIGVIAMVTAITMANHNAGIAYASQERAVTDKPLSFEIIGNGTDTVTVQATAVSRIDVYSVYEYGISVITHTQNNTLTIELNPYDELGQIMIYVRLGCGNYQRGAV